MQHTLHVIPNAHLDPVWLWDWREGLNEGIGTVRAVLDLMDEFSELTFIRGEALIYQHIAEYDPATFARIRKRVEEGRWEIVGGTMLQMDTNLPSTEVFDRQFENGKRYFRETFGKDITIAWAADSFGHSGGLPDILARHGIDSFAFTRPMTAQMSINKAVFRWQGVGGAEVLAYRPHLGWYGCDRGDVIQRLDHASEEAKRHGQTNVPCFIGLGNHGGGPTRRHITEILTWRDAHPEVAVRFSGLGELFRSLREELSSKPADFAPVVQGELGYTLRGCYSSAAAFKFAYRKAEAQVSRAQKTINVINSVASMGEVDPLKEAWDGLLFNSFHDILPGSSIERAMTEQQQWVGGVIHSARRAEFDALNRLHAQIDTRPIEKPTGDMPAAATLLVLNPHDREYDGYIELEAAIDYRPILSYANRAHELPVKILDGQGAAVSFQRIATEHSFMPDVPWRVRALTHVRLSARAWAVFDVAYSEQALPVETSASAEATDSFTITNDQLTVIAKPGSHGVQIIQNGRSIFGDDALSFALFADSQGSWGDMSDKITCHADQTEQWTIRSTRVVEAGPHRATLHVHIAGDRSEIDLTISLCDGRNAVDFAARLFWNEHGPRLKMTLPAGDRATFDIPGGQIRRGPLGEVPGGRWVVIHSPTGDVGFASDALYNFDSVDGKTRATIVRSAPFAADSVTPNAFPDRVPLQDRGEHRFNFVIAPDAESIATEALFLEQRIIVQTVPAHPGLLARAGSLTS